MAWSPKGQNSPSLGASRWAGENETENNTTPPIQPVSTFWIEDFSKKSPEDLWSSFRKTLKQEIKKGEGFAEIGECQDESELRQFYSIYLRTVKGHKNIPLPFSAFSFFLNGARFDPQKGGQTPKTLAKIFLAKKDGRVIGGSVFLLYSPFIHYFISASDERFRNSNIGHQILWHVMQKYAGGEYDYFDLGGTRKGSSLEVFKRGWGSREYPIYEIGKEVGESRKSYLRNLIAIIPPIIMRRLSHPALWAKI